MGRFIVIDGLDASGKETQAGLLSDALNKMGIKTRVLSFPMYENESSAFVKMYLSGRLGEHPEDTNAYAASSFFAADRYISYRLDWKKDIEDPNTVVIANRYTTANAVHQLAKLKGEHWDEFLSWLWDYEFSKLGIPVPDDIVYLEMLPEISIRLLRSRSESTGRTVDIHETDKNFIENSYRAAIYCSEKLGWTKITCYEGNEPRSREDIHAEVIKRLGYEPCLYC